MKAVQLDLETGKSNGFNVSNLKLEQEFTGVTVVYGEKALMSFLKVNNDATVRDVLQVGRQEFHNGHKDLTFIDEKLEAEIYPSVNDSVKIGQCKRLNSGKDPIILVYPNSGKSPIMNRMAEKSAELLDKSEVNTYLSEPPELPPKKDQLDPRFDAMFKWYKDMRQWFRDTRAEMEAGNKIEERNKRIIEMNMERQARVKQFDEMDKQIEDLLKEWREERDAV